MDRADEIIQKYLDQVVSEGEMAELNRMLVNDPEVARAFAKAARLDSYLDGHFRESAKAVPLRVESDSKRIRIARRHRTSRRFMTGRMEKRDGFPRAWTLVAACVGVVVLLFFLLPSKSDRPAEKAESELVQRKEELVRVGGERKKAEERIAEIERERSRLVEAPKPPPPGKSTEVEDEKVRQEALARLEEEQKKRETELREAQEKEKKIQAEVARVEKERLREKTVATVATLERVRGEVYVTSPSSSERSPAREGLPLIAGQGVATLGGKSLAVVFHPDSTRLDLEPDTKVVYSDVRNEIFLAEGRVRVEAAKRRDERVLATPHAEVRLVGTRFILSSGPRGTRLEMLEGSAQFTDLAGGKPVRVEAGQVAVAAACPGVDRKRMYQALKRGVDYLKKAGSPSFASGVPFTNSDELILYTCLHAGVSERDPFFQELFRRMLESKLERTYKVALQAMILEAMDRVKYQKRIAACAQFLIDNQCSNGQWGYGDWAVVLAKEASPGGRDSKEAASEYDPAACLIQHPKPKVVRKVGVQRKQEGFSQGDNSNLQYAVLGLRACSDAGVAIPKDTLLRAAAWLRESQHAGVGEDLPAGARGWGYLEKNSGPAYSSMTAGAVGCLAICDSLLGVDWRKDDAVRAGMKWLERHFTVTEAYNAGGSYARFYHGYYLYALERAGALCGTERFGSHEWYPAGVNVLFDTQKADGSWGEDAEFSRTVWDTCFAVLFLRRATPPLEEGVSGRGTPTK